MKKILYVLFLLLPVLSVEAQTVYKEQVRVKNTSVTRGKDNRLTISMDLIMQANMKISSNRAATLTPMLQADGVNKALPAILVYGRRRALVNERNRSIPKDAYAVIRRKRGTEQKVSYLIQLPYEKWMQSAELTLNADLCGCCNVVEESPAEDLITTLNLIREKVHFSIAYITPQAEKVKQRSLVGKAFLDFPVNQMAIVSDYRKNPVELAKIRATIDTVRNDKNTSITGIAIAGYASPEGKYASNARLADGRANALMQYVRSFYNFSPDVFKVTSTPEDWAGYRDFIVQSNLDKKQEVLSIIDSAEKDFDVKERRIATLVGADTYLFLLANCYPALRHSDYTVAYTIRGFTVEEAKELIKSQPQQLSLQEIFNVAQAYEPGSEGFNHAFQAAVLMYPDDAVANLNAAAMEIQKGGDLTAAKKFLAKANPQASTTLNNLGVIALMENDLDAAEKYLLQAKAAGSPEADANLRQVAK